MTADASGGTYTVGTDFVLSEAVPSAVQDAGVDPRDVVGIATEDRATAYDAFYEQSTVPHDFLGRESRVLHRLEEIRNAVVEA